MPNAARLMSSLRSTGYDSYSAIEDIIDNSIDAGATRINVRVAHEKKELLIEILDNGSGMSDSVLDEALKLGSNYEKDTHSDLGKFGMGLVTASISMAKKLEVITCAEDGKCFYAAQDLDEIESSNSFSKEQREATKDESKTLLDFTEGDTGTMVRISKVDRLSDQNISQFAAKLGKDIARIFRKFIEAGLIIELNDKKIGSADPLWRSDKETRIWSDEEYLIPGSKEKVRAVMAILPPGDSSLQKERGFNIKNQGFYVLRNNREIASGISLDVFKKHNDFNRLRIELSFDASLDDVLGIRFSKDGVKPNQAVTDMLVQELGGQITSIRRLAKEAQKADQEKELDHKGAAEVIAKKGRLLITPDREKEKRSPRTSSDKRNSKSTGTTKERKNIRNVVISSTSNVRFETLSMGREGVLYSAYQEGKTVVVQYNADHPFYERVLLENKSDRNIVSAIDYLLYAMATAELKNGNEQNVELLANIKSVMSTNLRTLLG